MTSTAATGSILTACLALFPQVGAAQTPESPSPAIAQQTAGSPARGHLDEAERLLNGIPQDSLKREAKKKIGELRENFAGLVKAYQGNGDPFVPAAVQEEADVKPDEEGAPLNWKMYFSDVENDLAGILGGGSSLPLSTPAGAGSVVSAAAAPVGTSGTTAAPATQPADSAAAAPGAVTTPTASIGTAAAVGDIGIKDLDPGVRRQLEQFRLEVELFFAEMTMNFARESVR